MKLFEQYQKGFEDGKKAGPDWIPVSERLPDKNGKCLVSLDFGDVSLDSYDKDWGFVCYVGNVIAWMPLPAPYTTDHQEESDGQIHNRDC